MGFTPTPYWVPRLYPPPSQKSVASKTMMTRYAKLVRTVYDTSSGSCGTLKFLLGLADQGNRSILYLLRRGAKTHLL